MAEILIGDHNWQQYANHDPVVNGQRKLRGLIPRDFQAQPHGSLMYAQPFNIPLIPESEWQPRLDALIAAKAQMSDVRNVMGPGGQPIPSRDQDQKGYCFPAGTPVTMGDGSKRPIERVSVGDYVQTRNGKPRRVSHSMSRFYRGEMIGLNIRGIEAPLVSTADHLIENGLKGWTCARDFKPGDYIVKSKEDGSYCWGAVYAVKRRNEDCLRVFDFEVEEDHNFIANGIVVHNCWAHSGVSAHLICRALMNEPYADLSAFAVACMIKNFRDEGGWGGEGVDFQSQKGCPTSEFWPQQSMSRSNDNAQTWANAVQHKYIQWMDLDPNRMKEQLITCLLLRYPVVSDFNWWSHSVCTIDLVSINPFKTRILNSWGDKWSENGTGLLEGTKAVPDSAIAAVLVSPSLA